MPPLVHGHVFPLNLFLTLKVIGLVLSADNDYK